MLTAIIVAGGSSRRMGFDKTFALLAEKPVVAHSIAAFEATDAVQAIIVVGREDRLPELREIVARSAFRKVRYVVAGGQHRQDSVSAGLQQVSSECEFVAVPDAARPLVQAAQIQLVYEAARAHGAASLAAPVADTLKRATDQHVVCGSVDREGLYQMQTPQIFARELLTGAYQEVTAKRLVITDEVSAVENAGREVVLVPNTEFNFKITFPADLVLAEMVLRQRGTC
jgi:2-C-methyl-D-erythritol 4-phosphate cytidylyltransferase